MKTFEFVLIAIILLTGLNAGIGFGNAIGYMPAMADTPTPHILSFWQHADHYFRARMPFFGNAILLSLVVGIFLFRTEWQSLAFWCLVLAFMMSASELVVILTQNLPLNKIIQTLDPEKPLGIDFEPVRNKAIRTFYIRSTLTIATFLFAIATAVTYLRSNYVWIKQ